MGIEVLKVPTGTVDAGLFSLPPAFDATKHAAAWVEEGQVEMKQQREVLVGSGFTADGWRVWKKNSRDEATKVSVSKGRVFVLMCRSRKVQDQVNAIYGDVSKKNFNAELLGETTTGEKGPVTDPGILTEKRLKGVIAGEASEAEESQLPLNEERTE